MCVLCQLMPHHLPAILDASVGVLLPYLMPYFHTCSWCWWCGKHDDYMMLLFMVTEGDEGESECDWGKKGGLLGRERGRVQGQRWDRLHGMRGKRRGVWWRILRVAWGRGEDVWGMEECGAARIGSRHPSPLVLLQVVVESKPHESSLGASLEDVEMAPLEMCC